MVRRKVAMTSKVSQVRAFSSLKEAVKKKYIDASENMSERKKTGRCSIRNIY